MQDHFSQSIYITGSREHFLQNIQAHQFRSHSEMTKNAQVNPDKMNYYLNFPRPWHLPCYEHKFNPT